MIYLGDYQSGDFVVDFKFSTNDGDGAAITYESGTVSAYKGSSTTESLVGIVVTKDFDGLTGLHHCRVYLASGSFFESGYDYMIVAQGIYVDSQYVNSPLAHFSIEQRLTSAGIVDEVWNEFLSDHTITGSAGAALQLASEGGDIPTVEEIADQVWNELVEDHQATGTFGARLEDAAGNVPLEPIQVENAVWNAYLSAHILTGSAGVALQLASEASATPTVQQIVDGVWNEPVGSHQATGTFGARLEDAAESSGLTAQQVEDAVWDAFLSAHILTGSAGAALLLATQYPATAVIVDGVWDESVNDHQVTGTFGARLEDAAESSGLTAQQVENAVWDAFLSAHTITGSAGAALLLATQYPTVALIADGVWDESVNDHQATGTFGARLEDAAESSGLTVQQVEDAVWDAFLSDHTITGSAGSALQLASVGGSYPTVDEIADGVWDESVNAHQATGTFGARLEDAAEGADPVAVAAQVWDQAKVGHVVGGSFGEEVQSHSTSAEVGALNDLSSAQVSAAVIDYVIEGALTLKHFLRLIGSSTFLKTTGAGTTSPKFRDLGDTKDRIDGTVDGSGNRTNVTLDAA